jgi:4-cresol dehydrogenase (hydroxylating)
MEAASGAFDLLEGVPSAAHLPGARWRAKQASEAHLREAGLIWVSPVLPLCGRAVEEVRQIVEPIFKTYRFDPLITMTAVTERAICCVMSINYDRCDDADVQRAAACNQELYASLSRSGYYPYRRASC